MACRNLWGKGHRPGSDGVQESMGERVEARLRWRAGIYGGKGRGQAQMACRNLWGKGQRPGSDGVLSIRPEHEMPKMRDLSTLSTCWHLACAPLIIMIMISNVSH